ncbi:alkaline phosphatase D family protein [Massilia sp. PAMC28688]|uniref:alkaline phosphatase D family protein n=1 Tax=Massilia sp. PAMC28688 TaxID=2861283 RepID=UPI001C636421|nr:alkaline phosphatase D family protein [Massilia sp. PAMC28688]QYF95478.1 alkaline phosphatase D family protein [Massilia sp. PAMC28688]
MEQQRREFLLQGTRLAGIAAALGSATPLALGQAPAVRAYPFSLGVASGSPLPDSVILWTRILPDPLNAASVAPVALVVRWEVAHDQAFTRMVAKGSASAVPELAHSVHVDVKGLDPARWYFYRFMLGDAVSPVGRTRTAPAAAAMPTSLKLAVASCQHWEFGSYAAHRHIAAAGPDLVAFLGDYIYEWGPYHLRHPARAQRVDESFTLAQYRARYAQYKTDRDLQASHHAAPWIVTWDDHEVANDYARDRDERLSPDFPARRAAAYQAFYEHMPVRLMVPRPGAFGDMRIYQRYDWGQLARLHVLDDRQYRAAHACPARKERGGSSSVTRACKELRDPARSMLGAAQEAWLADGFATSRARWNIVAQQTPMAQSSQLPLTTPNAGRFWNDGWDGYPVSRERLFDALRESRAQNPVILSGDVHTFYATDLKPDFNRPASKANPVIATEFCGTSVTSGSRPQARTLQYVDMNPHVKYGRSDKRGFMLMEITPSVTNTFFMGLDDVRDPATGMSRLATFSVANGKPGPRQTG